MTAATTGPPMAVNAQAVSFATEPSRYRHWRLQTDSGRTAEVGLEAGGAAIVVLDHCLVRGGRG